MTSERSIDGYDSDPEYRFIRPPRSPSKNRLHSSSFYVDQEKIKEKKCLTNKGSSVTIPHPFSFSYREKKRIEHTNEGESGKIYKKENKTKKYYN